MSRRRENALRESGRRARRARRDRTVRVLVRHMVDQLGGARPEFAVWGAVIPNLAWSNIAREVLMDAEVSPAIAAGLDPLPSIRAIVNSCGKAAVSSRQWV